MVVLPCDDGERLAELIATGALSTAPSPELESVVEILRDFFHVPIALITLLDHDRQVFKAKFGLDIDGTDRDVAFCRHTVLGSEPFIVEDAALDPRFADNPLVVGPPHIRFYAGAPLEMRPGVSIGSVCIIDRIPRRLSSAEIATLTRMAGIVVRLITAERRATEAVMAKQESERAHRELAIRERIFLHTERMAKVAGWERNHADDTMLWSDELYRITEVPLGTFINGDRMLSFHTPETIAEVFAARDAAIAAGTSFEVEIDLITATGQIKRVRLCGELEYVDGQPVRDFGIMQDISAEYETRARLWRAAHTDTLTQLGNRKHFQETLAAAIETGQSCGVLPGLLILDMDRLKETNDTLGHDFGDAMIAEVAERLRAVCGSLATPFRLGGDEFAVIIAQAPTIEHLGTLARRLIKAVGEPMVYLGQTLRPSISVGGALLDPEAPRGDILRRNADLALYQAKEGARGSFAAYDDQLRTTITRRIETIRHVETCLDEARIIPWYQPVIELSSGRVHGFEALARIRLPDGRIQSMGEVFEALDDARNATRLTEQMLAAVASDLAGWLAAGIHLQRVSINVGSADFALNDLEQRLDETLGRAGVPFEAIAIEVTETVFLGSNCDTVGAQLQRLRDRGIRVGLDDFGTGYASLTHLRSLPVDAIKIDRSFIERLTTDRTSDAIVSMLVALADRLDLSVIAEGVETEDQVKWLADLGCGYGQGYYFSRPLPARDAGALIGSVNATGGASAVKSLRR